MILRSSLLFGLIFLLSSFLPLLAADSMSLKTRAEKDQHCYVCLNTRSWLHYLFPCLCNEPLVPGYNSKGEQERFPFASVVRQAKKEKRAKTSLGSKQKFTLFKSQFLNAFFQGARCCTGKCVGKCLLACIGPKVLIAFGSISLGLLVGLYRTVTDWEQYKKEMMMGNYPEEYQEEEDQKDDQEFLAKTTKSFKFPIKLPKKQQVKVVFLPGQSVAPSVLSLDKLIRKQFDKYQLFFILEIVLVAVFVVAYFAQKVKRAKRRNRNGKQQQPLLKTTLAKREQEEKKKKKKPNNFSSNVISQRTM